MGLEFPMLFMIVALVFGASALIRKEFKLFGRVLRGQDKTIFALVLLGGAVLTYFVHGWFALGALLLAFGFGYMRGEVTVQS